MVLNILSAQLDLISLVFFSLCFIVSTITSGPAFTSGHTARAVRSQYRQTWAQAMIKKGELRVPVDIFRNNITVSSALLGGLVIGFGLVANAFLSYSTANIQLFLVFVIAIMTYAIFNILMEIRTLTYIPLMFSVPSELIEEHEKKTKEEYIGRLLDRTYDNFSNSIRALFYLIALLVFPLNGLLFMASTLLLTYLFVRRDISGKSRIEIF